MSNIHSIPSLRSKVPAANLLDLETPIHEAERLTRIAGRLLDGLLSVEHAKQAGPEHLSLTITRADLEDLHYAVHEAQNRVANIAQTFDAVFDAGRAN